MPQKKRKYPKLPSGFGSIRKLSGNRRNPYCVQPTSQGLDINGCPIRPKPLCYVDSWYKGFAVLTAYNAGTYTPGMENHINIGSDPKDAAESMSELVRGMLNNYALITQRITGNEAEIKKTFAEVYREYYADKFEKSGKQYSDSTVRATKSAFKNVKPLHDKSISDLRYADLQKVVDDCPLKHASLEFMVTLIKQVFAYAELMEYIDKDYSKRVTIRKTDDDEHGVPFSIDEIRQLWKDKDDPTAEMLLIMIFSGHRISEYDVAEINVKEAYFEGGVKTETSKNRIVPMHSAIIPLVKKRLRKARKLIGSQGKLRKDIKAYCSFHGMISHTPHDTRHTFAMLCDKYNVKENDKKRMLGHAFNDVTNSVYGHRSLEDLRIEIEKIKVSDFL